MEQLKLSCIIDGNVNHSGKRTCQFLIKLYIHLQLSSNDLEHLSQGNENICSQKNLYTNVQTALFVIAKTWKQPKGPSTRE